MRGERVLESRRYQLPCTSKICRSFHVWTLYTIESYHKIVFTFLVTAIARVTELYSFKQLYQAGIILWNYFYITNIYISCSQTLTLSNSLLIQSIHRIITQQGANDQTKHYSLAYQASKWTDKRFSALRLMMEHIVFVPNSPFFNVILSLQKRRQ